MGFLTKPERMKTVLRERITLHTKDGRSLEGILLGIYRDVVALAHVQYLVDDGRREIMSGEVFVPVGNISFLQAPHEAERG